MPSSFPFFNKPSFFIRYSNSIFGVYAPTNLVITLARVEYLRVCFVAINGIQFERVLFCYIPYHFARLAFYTRCAHRIYRPKMHTKHHIFFFFLHLTGRLKLQFFTFRKTTALRRKNSITFKRPKC